MKKITLLLFSVVAMLQAFAQKGNLILFAEEGERFYVVMNGVKQNTTLQTNVAVRGMPEGLYIVKIIFEDKSLGAVNDKINVMAGFERTFNIKKKKNNAGEMIYVTRLLSQNPIPVDMQEPVAEQQVVVYQPIAVPVDGATTVTQTTTTRTTNGGDNVNMNMNVGGVGMGVNINTIGMDMGGVSSTTTTTTTRTTSSSTMTNSNYDQPVQQQPAVVYVPGYNGPIGCPMPMSIADFQSAKASIASKSFEETKLQIAKQIVGANCCTAAQVREIMKMFSFEQSKLDFAKFAYKYTYDQKNYYKVNDAFEFESSTTELNSFITGE